MKTFKLSGVIFLASILFLVSCKETGPEGPQGPQGEQGPQGVPGANGSTTYNGDGEPDADLGKVGDYYLDTSENELYGPKTASGWGTSVVLQGPKGEPGTANVIYSDWQKFDWGSYNPSKARQIIEVPQLTTAFMDKGVVLVYVRKFGNPLGYRYYQLPYDFSYLYNCRMGFFVSAHNQLILDLFPTDGAYLDSQFMGDDYAFRYVLIPGGIPMARSLPPPDPKDYKATCEYYGILE